MTFSDLHPRHFQANFPTLPKNDFDWLADALAPLIAQESAAGIFASYQQLAGRFPPEAAFWSQWRRYLAEHDDAQAQIAHFSQGNWQGYADHAPQILRGRHGLIRGVIAGLAELSQQHDQALPLAQALSDYLYARALVADLENWQADLQAGRLNSLLTRLLEAPPPHLERMAQLRWLSELTYLLFTGGHIAAVYEQAIQALDRTAAHLPLDMLIPIRKKLQKVFWANLLYRYQPSPRTAGDVRAHLHERPFFHLKLPPPQNPLDKLIHTSLDFLVRHWRADFSEAIMMIWFFKDHGFDSPYELHQDNIFQRATMADTFCEANEHFQGLLTPLVEHEIGYLLKSRRVHGVGGWGYFPDLKELPVDCDDMAQVMQVLLRTRRRAEVEATCEHPLHILLTQNRYPNGAFETWIIPTENPTDEEQLQRKWSNEMWGAGPDPDAMSNLLYALHGYDAPRFATIIAEGIDYLASRQEADGSWRSTWYFGALYGTFVGARLLAVAAPDHPARARAKNFLLETQQYDGGWRISDDENDPLSTALALVALATFPMDDLAPIKRGFQFLQRSQLADGGWSQEPFIRMDVGRPEGKIHKTLAFGCRCITTAFALKAALHWTGKINL